MFGELKLPDGPTRSSPHDETKERKGIFFKAQKSRLHGVFTNPVNSMSMDFARLDTAGEAGVPYTRSLVRSREYG